MSDDSFLDRRVEHFWGLRPGEAGDMANRLFLDSVEYMEIQQQIDVLAGRQLKSEANHGGNN